MTTIAELPALPPKEILAVCLPWTSRRMVRQAEPFGEGIVDTVIALLKFLHQCADLEWVDPREVKDPPILVDPDAKTLETYRRWLIPMIREMATQNRWCFVAPDITRNMFQETGVDIYAVDGYDVLGLGPDGYDRFGFNTEGRHRDGRLRAPHGPDTAREKHEREGAPEPVYDSRTGLNESGYKRDGTDEEGYNESGFNARQEDRWGNTWDQVTPVHWRDILAHYNPALEATLKPRPAQTTR